MKKHPSFLLSMASLLLVSPLLFAQSPSPRREIRGIAPGGIRRNEMAIQNQYIVVLKDSVASQAASTASNLAEQYGGSVIHIYGNAIKGFSVRLPEAAALALSQNPLVSYVEEDAIIEGDSTPQTGQPGDRISLQRVQPNAPWGLDRIDQRDLPLSTTYTYAETGAGVHVYVIDSGIQIGRAHV